MYPSVYMSSVVPVTRIGITPVATKQIVSIASGRVRRHSRVGTSPAVTTTAKGRHGRSGRSTPSSTASGMSTPTSAQSRHTRTGGSGGRGSNHTERTKPYTASWYESGYGKQNRHRGRETSGFRPARLA